jgi:hypothetical protein
MDLVSREILWCTLILRVLCLPCILRIVFSWWNSFYCLCSRASRDSRFLFFFWIALAYYVFFVPRTVCFGISDWFLTSQRLGQICGHFVILMPNHDSYCILWRAIGSAAGDQFWNCPCGYPEGSTFQILAPASIAGRHFCTLEADRVLWSNALSSRALSGSISLAPDFGSIPRFMLC